MRAHLLNGDVMQIPLEDQSVHCIVTSPPYWGLRSYNTGDHKELELGSEPLHDCGGWVTGQDCGACFVCHVRQYARELWRVLRDDGTFWLNLGDSYNGSGGAGGDYNTGGLKDGQPKFSGRNVSQLKPKDLCGIPWRVALALQADGWYLRSDIIWHKPNPMPESVTDRPTKAHEYLFLLTKSKKYYYDANAVREGYVEPDKNARETPIMGMRTGGHSSLGKPRTEFYKHGGRNRRTVWKIPTSPYSGAHFATFPPALVEPCIKAGTSERGCCPVCGQGWERVVNKSSLQGPWHDNYKLSKAQLSKDDNQIKGRSDGWWPNHYKESLTTGWQPACDCPTHDPVPCTVFDPFSGSGTTVMVANQLGRRGIGLDLSTDYIELAQQRTGLTALQAWQNGLDATAPVDLGPMFAKLETNK